MDNLSFKTIENVIIFIFFQSETKFVLREILFIFWLTKDFQKLKIY